MSACSAVTCVAFDVHAYIATLALRHFALLACTTHTVGFGRRAGIAARATILGIAAHIGAAGGTIAAGGVFPILNFFIQYLYFLLILTAKKHYFGSPKNFCD